jgi:hypothetical protein
MRELGLREWTALAALVFGVMLGFVFLDPANGEPQPPLEIVYGNEPTPTPRPLPTEQPPSRLPTPARWDVRFASISNGREVVDSGRVIPELNLSFPNAPFPDYRDNSWKVTAATTVELGEGTSLFTIHYDCEIRVFIDDQEIASRGEPKQAEDLVVTFPHESGNFTIRIEATDGAGAFLLQYRPE